MGNRTEMGPVAVKSLAKWLREQIYHVKEGNEEARFRRVVVKQIVKGNKNADEAFTIEIPKNAKDDWTENAALECYTRLSAEAGVLGGFQRWALYSYFSDDTANHLSRHLIGIQGSDDEEGYESEGTDRHGQVSQQMRHSEAMAKLLTSQTMTILSAQNSMLAQLSTIAEESLSKRMEALELYEAVIKNQQEHEVNMLKEGARAEALRDVGKRVTGLVLPAIANRISGASNAAIKGNALLLMAKSLVTNLAGSEERMTKFMAMLTPEEQIAFMNFYEEVSKTNEDGSSNATTEEKSKPPPNGVS